MKIIEKIERRIRYRVARHKAARLRDEQTPIRWGIIGLGYMAEVFGRALDCSPDSRIAAVASRSEEKARAYARKHRAGRYFASYDEMLRKMKGEIDVIYIATPHKFHYRHIEMCLEAGYNVLCEKLIASNLEEYRSLMDLAREKGLFLMEGMWTRCLPTVDKAREWIARGRIGKVKAMKVELAKKAIIDPRVTSFNPEMGGGVMLDYGVYPLGLVLCFLGAEYRSVEKYVQRRNDGLDTDWTILMRYEDACASVSISSVKTGWNTATLIGERGTIEWAAPFNRTGTVRLYDGENRLVETFAVRYLNEGFEYEVREVVDSLRAHRIESRKVSMQDTLAQMELIEELLTGMEA